MGDRVAVLKDGYLQQVDTPQALYERPANLFVAAFIGSPSMNLFDATVTLDGNGGSIQLGNTHLALSQDSLMARPALHDYAGKRVVVGIRPQDLDDADTVAETTADRTLTTPVTLVEALGSEILVHLVIDAPSVDSGDPDAPESLPVQGKANTVGRFSPKSRLHPGQLAEVVVNTENIHFDADTKMPFRNTSTRSLRSSRGVATRCTGP